MDPITGAALITGGASLVGGLIGNNQNKRITRETNAHNAREAARNRSFQRSMRETSYQASMKDMRRAGLNPMLAFQQGGAATPTGAQAVHQAYKYEDPIGPAANSALAARDRATVANEKPKSTKIQKDLAEEQKKRTKIQDTLASADIALKAAAVEKEVSSAKKIQTEARKIQKESRILDHREKKENVEGKFYESSFGAGSYYINKIMDAIGLGSNAKKFISPLLNRKGKGKGRKGKTREQIMKSQWGERK